MSTIEETNLKAWNRRNRHVLEIQEEARTIVGDRIEREYPKADIVLLAELMLDLVKRFD
jgi:hypothetical protein